MLYGRKIFNIYRNIIFDLGGVLVHFSPKKTIELLRKDGYEISEEIAAKVLSIVHLPEHHAYDRGLVTRYEYIESIKTKLFPNEVHHELVSVILEKIHDDILPLSEGIELVRGAKAQGYSVYILSNLSSIVHEKLCTKVPFPFVLFDGAIFSYQTKTIKPEPDIYYTLLQTYKLQPEQCLFLDDMHANIQTGKELGIDGIVYENAEQVRKELVLRGICF